MVNIQGSTNSNYSSNVTEWNLWKYTRSLVLTPNIKIFKSENKSGSSLSNDTKKKKSEVPLTAFLQSQGLLAITQPLGQLEDLVASYCISPDSSNDVPNRGYWLQFPCSCGWARTTDDFSNDMLFPVLLLV